MIKSLFKGVAMKEIFKTIVIWAISALISKGLDKYGGQIMKEIIQTFIIESWFIWIGLAVVSIYWFVKFQLGIHNHIKDLNERISDWQREITSIRDNIEQHYRNHSHK